jgi:uncharacterized protein (DUF488 family)
VRNSDDRTAEEYQKKAKKYEYWCSMTLFTFGYEGLSIDSFVSELRAKRIDVVCDARELPLSRKKGFSKVALSEILMDAGIEYKHVRAFGCPSKIRKRYKLDGDWKAYQIAYRKHLKKQHLAVLDLALRARNRRICIICFEADPFRCHRSIVANAVMQHRIKSVTHLKIKEKSAVERSASVDK